MRRVVLAILGLVGLVLPAAGQQAGSRPWQQLTPEEQQRAWENYQRYQHMDAERQRMMEQRYRQFQAMPPQEQQRLRQNYETYRGLNSGQRNEFSQKYQRWKSGKR
jgi:hypothetical protein